MPTLPYLTEPWAIAYFEVAAAILLFGAGLPSLVMQAIVPEDVRRIVHRRRLLKWAAFSVVLFVLISLSFVWLLRPEPSCADAPPSLKNLSGAIVISGAILALIPFWYVQTLHRRDRILRFLKRKCERSVRKRGSLDDTALLDIRHLGQYGQHGIEKEQALEVLDQLAERIRSHSNYAGAGLRGIIKAIQSTVVADGNGKNVRTCLEILERVAEDLTERGLESTPDMGATLRALEEVGATALQLDAASEALYAAEIVGSTYGTPDEVPSAVTRCLYQLGVLALDSQRYLLAASILNKLEGIICRQACAAAHEFAYYLGFVAHFWSASESAQERLSSSLNSTGFAESVESSIVKAREYLIRQTLFETADFLSQMLTDIPFR